MRKLRTKEKFLFLVKVSCRNCIYWIDSNRQVWSSGIRSKASLLQWSPEACNRRDLNILVLVVFSGVLWSLMQQTSRLYFFIIKPTRCTQIYSGMKICMARAVPLPIIRSLFTVNSALVYIIQVCRQLSNRTRMALLEGCLQTCMTYTSAECTVNKLLMMGRRTARDM